MIKLSENFSMPVDQYANQKNSITGMPGCGKTYTATDIAEQLMDNEVPILVFDPIGVWQNLRYGTDGAPGYPIVVAGGMKADIALSESNVTEIILAAQKEGISLIIDLFGMETATKSKWINIVEKSVHHLLYTNQNYGLRHVFFEEAHEFIPQQTNPGNSAVVAGRIQSLASMGRNIGIGCTFITQRSEKLHKDVFEISHNVILHRQTGRNSLKAINEWLKLKGIEYKEIIQTLPKLEIGECWLIQGDSEHKIQIAPKKTFHPNPQDNVNIAPIAAKTDVSHFIEKMKEAMNLPDEKIQVQTHGRDWGKRDELIKKLHADNAELKTQNNLLTDRNKQVMNQLEEAREKLRKIGVIAGYTETDSSAEVPVIRIDRAVEPKARITTSSIIYQDTIYNSNPESPVAPPKIKPARPSGPVGGSALRILKTVAMFHPNPVSKTRVGLITNLSTTSGSFGTYIATLKREGFVAVTNNQFSITDYGREIAGEVEPVPTGEALINMWCRHIGGSAARILLYLAENYPDGRSKADIGAALELSPTSGSFGTYVSTLKRNGLITAINGVLRASDELYN